MAAAALAVAALLGGCVLSSKSNLSATADPAGAAAITLACGDAPSSGAVSSEATLATGGVLTITLCDVGGDGGYSWADPVYEPNAEALVGQDSIAPPNQPGAAGSSVWRLQVLSAGSSTVTFADRRIWEKNIPPFLSVVVSVRATPSSSFTPLPVITAAPSASASGLSASPSPSGAAPSSG